MANTVADLLLILRGDTSDSDKALTAAQVKLRELGGAADGLAGRLAALGPALSAAALALPLAGIGAEALHAAEKFETAMRTIQNRTGATEEQLKGLEGSFKNVYAATAANSADVAAALATLSTRSGLTGKALEDLTGKVLTLARRSGTDVGDLAQGLTKAFSQWSVATNQQSAAMDKLFTVSQRSAVPLDRLTSIVTQFSPQLHAFGLNFNEAASLVGKFEAAGINTENVMVAMSRGIATAAKNGLTGADAISFLVQRVKEAKTPAEALTVAMDEFGKRAGLGVYQAIQAGRFDDLLTGQFKRTANAIDEVAPALKNWSAEWIKFQKSVELALLPIGQPLLTALTNSVEAMNPLVGALKYVSEGFGNLPTAIQETIFGLAGIGVAAPIAGKGLKLLAEGFKDLQLARAASGLAAIPGAINSINFALQNGLTGALTGFEASLLKFGYAGALLIGIAAGWSLAGDEAEKAGRKHDEAAGKVKKSVDIFADVIAGAKGAAGATNSLGSELDQLWEKAKKSLGIKTLEELEKAAAAAKKLEDEFKRAESTLGFKSPTDEVKELNAAFQTLKNSGRLTLTEIADAASVLQLKMAGLDVSDEALKVLGVNTKESEARLRVLSIAMDQVTARYEAGRVPLATYTAALESFNAAQKTNLFVGPTLELASAARVLDVAQEGLLEDLNKLNKEFLDQHDTLQLSTAAFAALQATGNDLGNMMARINAPAQAVKQNLKDLRAEVEFASAAFRVGGISPDQYAASLNRLKTAVAEAANGEAFRDLGIKSQASLDLLAEKAREDYERIRSDASSVARDIVRAWVAMIDAQLAAGARLDDATAAQYERAKASVSSATKQMDSDWRKLGQEISTITTDMSRGIAAVIVKGESLGQVFQTVGQQISEALLRRAIEQGTKPLLADLDQLLSKLPAIAKLLNSLFGPVTTAVKITTPPFLPGGIPGLDDEGNPIGAATKAAGGAGSTASAAAGSLLSNVLGFANLGVNIAAGIVQGIQMAHQETSLNAIEHNTRYSMMYLGERADGGILGQLFKLNGELAFGTLNKTVNFDIAPNVRAIKDLLKGGVAASGSGPGSGGVVINGPVTIEVSGSADPVATARAVMDTLRDFSPKFQPA